MISEMCTPNAIKIQKVRRASKTARKAAYRHGGGSLGVGGRGADSARCADADAWAALFRDFCYYLVLCSRNDGQPQALDCASHCSTMATRYDPACLGLPLLPSFSEERVRPRRTIELVPNRTPVHRFQPMLTSGQLHRAILPVPESSVTPGSYQFVSHCPECTSCTRGCAH